VRAVQQQDHTHVLRHQAQAGQQEVQGLRHHDDVKAAVKRRLLARKETAEARRRDPSLQNIVVDCVGQLAVGAQCGRLRKPAQEHVPTGMAAVAQALVQQARRARIGAQGIQQAHRAIRKMFKLMAGGKSSRPS
jgi:hypothetical protein